LPPPSIPPLFPYTTLFRSNSPKMTFLKELNIAFANGDVDDILNRVSDDITWELVGGRKLDGLDAFSKELEKMKENLPSEFILDLDRKSTRLNSSHVKISYA